MTTDRKLTANIVGGGIGGLCAALTLKRAGIDVRVFEAAREYRLQGVGINLQPHSVLVLHQLGLSQALQETGIQTAELIYVNKFGQRDLAGAARACRGLSRCRSTPSIAANCTRSCIARCWRNWARPPSASITP